MVLDRPDPAHLLAATGATRTAVNENGQRRAVARRSARAIPVNQDDATMPGGRERTNWRAIAGS